MNNIRTAMIHISTSQSDGHGEVDNMAFFTEGEYYEKEGSRYITYKESEISGMEGTTTTIQVSGQIVSLIRTGNVSSTFMFTEGKATQTAYQTGYGIFDIRINADRVEIQQRDDLVFIIHLKYEMIFDMQDAVINDMEIKVTLSR